MDLNQQDRDKLIEHLQDAQLLAQATDKLLDMSKKMIPLLMAGDAPAALQCLARSVDEAYGLMELMKARQSA